jgi:hypothetical protein
MSDEKLEAITKEYAELAKDKNIDVSSLMVNALSQGDDDRVATSTRRWAYLVSIGLPPLGYAFALWFLLSSKSDAKTVAYWCVGLTTVSLFGSILLLKAMFSGAGIDPAEIQNINPNDVYQLTQ